MSIPTSGADLEAAALRDANTVKYCCVAGLAWIVYDILINVDREVTHFWFGKWSFPRVLYFLNRYFSLARVVFRLFGVFGNSQSCLRKFFLNMGVWQPLLIPSLLPCVASLYVQTWTGAFEIWFLQTVLIYRVNSLYRTKKILISIIVFFLCSAAGVITIIMRSIETSRAAVCVQALHDSQLGEIWAFWAQWLGSTARVDIASLVIWRTPQTSAFSGDMQWTTGFSGPFFSIVGSRLLLNLREYGGVTEYLSTISINLPASKYRGRELHSAMAFAERDRTPESTRDDFSTGIHTTILDLYPGAI
ncbi:hypothetical protein K438DRAFT_1757388 [Mycena galopus ATCC 62051]|nr:hypothetical protein K438DRAFT_1757388 [Mycena galopus ATCC 62051]